MTSRAIIQASAMHLRRIILCLIPLFLFSCKGENLCRTSIGITNFSLEPNSAAYSGLNTVGGYEYLTGGNRGANDPLQQI